MHPTPCYRTPEEPSPPNPPSRQAGYKPTGDPALSRRSGIDALFCGQSVPLPPPLAACLQRLLAEASGGGSGSGCWAHLPKAPGCPQSQAVLSLQLPGGSRVTHLRWQAPGPAKPAEQPLGPGSSPCPPSDPPLDQAGDLQLGWMVLTGLRSFGSSQIACGFCTAWFG